ncbi:MAG: hypothetical protein CO094_08110 [Anaerolineae bacterium CG_4_9_14_3_um_filter_57_17]|nr:IS110 family transposase [bacterium]NCT22050.1 IS110 family transposase [bacterium]OIO85930.1 MAG: hypothetical protein AUK01_04680 [Anaerolineae bacterium CG2_30_57_67]PJB66070.1 MAG: hypothetical protein CO094_08110 [Anaerolineae bacterium CG_4_9_14_3_um_filter_57_17]
MRGPGCKHSEEEIGRALTGTWREGHLFVLKQSLELFDFFTEEIESCDEEIVRRYGLTRPEWPTPKDGAASKKKNSHSKNAPASAKEIRQHLVRIAGVDLTLVDGFGVSTAQTVLLEAGTDMGKFPTDKHYCAWLGLAPKHEISGGQVLKNATLKTKNHAGQAFRMAAQSVKRAQCPFGALYRRLKVRLGIEQATVATAHAIARVLTTMLKYNVDYDPASVNEYQLQAIALMPSS